MHFLLLRRKSLECRPESQVNPTFLSQKVSIKASCTQGRGKLILRTEISSSATVRPKIAFAFAYFAVRYKIYRHFNRKTIRCYICN